MPIDLAPQLAFKQNRALAGGVAFLGYNIGAIGSPHIVAYLIESYGWRGTLLLLGGILMHKIPISLTIRIENKSPHKEKSQVASVKSFTKELLDFSLYRNKKWVLFCMAYILQRGSIQGFIDHNPSRMIHLGKNVHEAAWMEAVSYISGTVSKIVMIFAANLLSSTWRPFVFTIGSILGVLASVILVTEGSYKGAIVGAALCGVNVGAYCVKIDQEVPWYCKILNLPNEDNPNGH